MEDNAVQDQTYAEGVGKKLKDKTAALMGEADGNSWEAGMEFLCQLAERYQIPIDKIYERATELYKYYFKNMLSIVGDIMPESTKVVRKGIDVRAYPTMVLVVQTVAFRMLMEAYAVDQVNKDMQLQEGIDAIKKMLDDFLRPPAQ